jgi:hypothetical protein
MYPIMILQQHSALRRPPQSAFQLIRRLQLHHGEVFMMLLRQGEQFGPISRSHPHC